MSLAEKIRGGGVSDFWGVFRGGESRSGPSGTVRDRPGPSGTVRDRPGPSGTVRDRAGVLGVGGGGYLGVFHLFQNVFENVKSGFSECRNVRNPGF